MAEHVTLSVKLTHGKVHLDRGQRLSIGMSGADHYVELWVDEAGVRHVRIPKNVIVETRDA